MAVTWQTPGVLALVSGVFHAAWNALAKSMQPNRGAALAIITTDVLVMTLFYPFVAAAPTVASLPWMVLAGLGEAGYVTALGTALSKGDLGMTYGVSRSAALLLVWPLGYLIFGDIPNGAAWIATGLLCVGMLLCQLKQGQRASSNFSLGWTLLTGACVGVYHTAYKGAVHAGATAITTFFGSILVAVPVLWVASKREVKKEAVDVAKRYRGTLLVAGAMSTASFVLAVLALSQTQSGRVLGLRNSSIGFAALFAWGMGERPSRLQWAGLLVMAVGVLALML